MSAYEPAGPPPESTDPFEHFLAGRAASGETGPAGSGPQPSLSEGHPSALPVSSAANLWGPPPQVQPDQGTQWPAQTAPASGPGTPPYAQPGQQYQQGAGQPAASAYPPSAAQPYAPGGQAPQGYTQQNPAGHGNPTGYQPPNGYPAQQSGYPPPAQASAYAPPRQPAGPPPAAQPGAYGRPGQPPAGQPLVGRPIPGYPVPGQPAAGQPLVGQPIPGYPHPGQPMPGQPVPQPVPAGTPWPPPAAPAGAQASAPPAALPQAPAQQIPGAPASPLHSPWAPPPGVPVPRAAAMPRPMQHDSGGRPSWFRRNLWGLLFLLPALAAAVLVPIIGDWDQVKARPLVEVTPAADHWVTYAGVKVRLASMSEEKTLPGYGGSTTPVPAGVRAIKVVLDFDGPSTALDGCQLFVVSKTGEKYAPNPNELDDAKLTYDTCSVPSPDLFATPAPTGPSPSPGLVMHWQTTTYYALPLSAYAAGVQIESRAAYPRYAMLS